MTNLFIYNVLTFRQMWTHNNKQVIIAINTESIQHIQFEDGTEERGFNAIKSFKHGIFVNPYLDRKKYLSLLKVFHPDVSNLNVNLATQIAQAIINAKDGTATVINPKKNNYQSQSQSQPGASTSSNYHSQWQQDTWSDWTSPNQQNSSHRNNWQNQHTKRDRSSHKSQQPKPKKDFETWLDYVPTNYWNVFGNFDTFERDRSVDFRIFKRCYYSYFDTELEIVFRKQCIYREKITAIHRNCLYVLHQLDLNSLTKNDLWTLCDYEAIAYNKFERKTELVDNIIRHLTNSSTENERATQPYWSIVLTSPRPLWKHRFIKCDYYNNFEQFNCGSNSQKQESRTYSRESKDNTSNYFNCGRYLKLKQQWLERDEFFYFLALTRNLAKKFNIIPTDCDGYPGYPLHILDLAWQKLTV